MVAALEVAHGRATGADNRYKPAASGAEVAERISSALEGSGAGGAAALINSAARGMEAGTGAVRAGPSRDACGMCGKSDGVSKLLKCSDCKNTLYCSSACQKADWPDHKSAPSSRRTAWRRGAAAAALAAGLPLRSGRSSSTRTKQARALRGRCSCPSGR